MRDSRLLLPLLLLAAFATVPACTARKAPPAEEGGSGEEADAMAGLPNGIALDERTVGAGQPDEATLVGLKERGYVMAIDLRREGEQGDVPGEIVEASGLAWTRVPIGGADFTAEDARALRAALEQAPADGKVLVYCGSGSRVGALWATMHALEEGMTPEQAVELARASGKVRDNALEQVREVVTAEQAQ